MQIYYMQAPVRNEQQSIVVQQYIDFCEKAEPKPPYCGESPDGLKFRMDLSGTQQYVYNSAIAQGTTYSGTITGTIQLPMTYMIKP